MCLAHVKQVSPIARVCLFWPFSCQQSGERGVTEVKQCPPVTREQSVRVARVVIESMHVGPPAKCSIEALCAN